MTLQKLKHQFQHNPNIEFLYSADELIQITVKSVFSTAIIHLQGAHVSLFQPNNQPNVLWLSPTVIYKKATSIRGGIPICWPWFGPHSSDSSKPAHGFARVSQFDVDKISECPNGEIEVQLKLESNKKTKALWPVNFVLLVKITIGKSLTVSLMSQVDEDQPVKLTEAIHSYFAVNDIKNTTLKNLENTEYFDAIAQQTHVQTSNNLTFTKETDRIYKNPNDQLLICSNNKNLVALEQQGANSTVVWNPWSEKVKSMVDFPNNAYQNMLCVEAANTGLETFITKKQQHVISQKITPV